LGTNKPNIAIILIDSLARQPFLEALEDDQLANFKELTRKATLYKNAYSPAASTTPSIASLLSGYYSIKFGVRSVRDPIPSKMPLITDILHDEGYTSLAEVTGPLGNELGLRKRFKHYNYRVKGSSTKWVKTLKKKIETLDQPRFLLLHIWEPHLPRYYDGKNIIFGNLQTDYKQYMKALKQVDSIIPELLETIDDTIFFIMGDHGDKVAKSLLTTMKLNLIRIQKRIPILRDKIEGITEGTDFAGHGYKNLPTAAETILITNATSKQETTSHAISTLDTTAEIISKIYNSDLPDCLNLDGQLLTKPKNKKRIIYSFSCSAANRNRCRLVAFTDDKIHIHDTHIGEEPVENHPPVFASILKYIHKEKLFITSAKMRYMKCYKKYTKD